MMPTTTITSWSSDTRAVTPNFTSRNRYVIQARIPSDPTTMRTSASRSRSELTTAPIVVRLALPLDLAETRLQGRDHLAELAAARQLGVAGGCGGR